MAQQIKVPDIGDVDEVEVIEICVAVGDRLGEDDPVVVIESDKASMEVPAGVAGTVAELLVSVGDTVTEGTPLARLEEDTAEAEGVAYQEGASSDEERSAGEQRSADDDVSADDEASADDTSSGGKSAAAGDESAARHKAGSEAQDDAAPPADGATRRQEIKVPDIGDAEDVVVIEVAVAEGDEVAAGDLLVVVESDKASMEIPADGAGRVLELHVREGSEVSEGSLLAVLEVSGAEAGEAPAEAPEEAAAAPDSEDSGAAGEGGRRSAGRAAPAAPAAAKGSAGPTPLDEAPSEPAPAIVAEGDSLADVPASPAVRRLARELGVDLRTIRGEGSGSRGRLTKDDVKAHVKARLTREPAAAGVGAAIPPIPVVDFSRFGPVEEEPLSRIRAAGAVNLHRSWLNLPHVTHHEEADVTELEAFRSELKGEAEARGTKVTPLAFIIRACCHVLKAHPRVNASLDGEVKHFILKHYYHIGFAVDTEQGLVVPVIRDADRLGIWELSERITDLADKARRQKLAMADMQGGTFSVSSLGNIGGTGFTPVINAPEVAILGVSRLTVRPQWNGSDFVPRKMLPLSLSYDHRAINGAEAGRFMMDLAAVLADVRRILL